MRRGGNGRAGGVWFIHSFLRNRFLSRGLLGLNGRFGLRSLPRGSAGVTILANLFYGLEGAVEGAFGGGFVTSQEFDGVLFVSVLES